MNYIEKLSSFTNLGKKSGKNKLIKYYSKLGNPQNKLKLIHVTGTAGKGSTSAMIANGLKNAGYKVGLFTSPHLLKLNERIKINNENISDIDLNNYIKYYFEKNPNLSFSEYLTLIMISYFIEKEVDFVVCETFVGGKYDTTNIFANSIATIITSIGLDHENLLGNTKKKILKDKLGILRKNTPLFTRLNNEIINEKINKIGAKYIQVYKTKNTNLKGKFQKENAGIAYEVLKYLNIKENIIKQSLNTVSWPGRIHYVEKNILIDCAHNPLGMEVLNNYIKKKKSKSKINNIYYLFALSNNKQYSDYEPYLKNAKEIIFSKPNIFKIQDPNNYLQNNNNNTNTKSSNNNIEDNNNNNIKYNNINNSNINNYKIIEDTQEAFQYLKSKLKENDLLVVCGSIYLASEILSIYDKM